MSKGIKEQTELAKALGYNYKASNGEFYTAKEDSPDYNPALDVFKEFYADVDYKDMIYKDNPFFKLLKKSGSDE